jgi:hypothetical protein
MTLLKNSSHFKGNINMKQGIKINSRSCSTNLKRTETMFELRQYWVTHSVA